MSRNHVILPDYESNIIRTKIEGELAKTLKNGWSPYWYPLSEVREGISVIAFNSDFWNDDYNMSILAEIFKSNNIKKVYTLQELGNVYIYKDYINEEGLLEQDEDGYTFPYSSEQYIWGSNHDWFIYISHEGTVAFAGEWLVREIKKI